MGIIGIIKNHSRQFYLHLCKPLTISVLQRYYNCVDFSSQYVNYSNLSGFSYRYFKFT